MKKKLQLKSIEEKYKELEQYDNSWGDELMAKKEEKYAQYIGTFLIRFSNLEHNLDIEIAELIGGDYSHDEGYIIIKDLKMCAKIELFYNLSFLMVNSVSEKRKKQNLKQLSLIRERMEYLSTIRNKIVHAKWDTLDENGFIRVGTKTNKENGLIKFRMLKITPMLMKQAMREIDILIEKIDTFTENIWQ
ncbi:MAG TPA: hypothetical protein PLQ44_01720 [Candidatus Paceibacterota bacterium]|nr:hypothetical protein [Candidatus Paceibacterota bacterium]HPT40304.1 hypothetical protein [Candidatus Paceibacterota bacterium]